MHMCRNMPQTCHSLLLPFSTLNVDIPSKNANTLTLKHYIIPQSDCKKMQIIIIKKSELTNASGVFVEILKENQLRKREPRGSIDLLLEFIKHADEAEETEDF